jgi:hypothetical protein
VFRHCDIHNPSHIPITGNLLFCDGTIKFAVLPQLGGV